MIETSSSMDTQLAEIKDLLHILIVGVRELKRERLPAAPEEIGALLHEIHKLFSSEEWTAAWVFEQSIDDDPSSMRLRALLSKCLNGRLTIRRLSYFLSRSAGLYGSLNLQSCGRSRDGQKFRIVTK